jgi:hypothetical protein
VKDEHDRLQTSALAGSAGAAYPYERIDGSRLRCLSCSPFVGVQPVFPADDDSLELHVSLAHAPGGALPVLREVAA